MGRSFQQQALRRKLTYLILVVVLLTVCYAVRHADFSVARVRVSGLMAQARALDLREQDQGQADLTGSTLNLIFTGSRGLVICGLWWGTDELKTRHEWTELEQSIKLITKLQPHFITPWLFQSHNLAYNVSWESDRLRDKYFYISRGLELLGDGIRRNRDNPDLRYHMGWYYQNKFGFSDQNKTLRSLLQLSCIDPVELDQARLFKDPHTVDLKVFEKFCQAHPFLVRRLREGLHLETPKEVAEFLLDNKKIPNRFQERADTSGENATRLKGPWEQFPILPPPSRFDPDAFSQDGGELPDSFNNFAAARAWFGYAQDPLELPPPLTRRPRVNPMVFRAQPARAQAFRAERMEEEGWFDADGWEITDWFPQDEAAPHGPKRVVKVGDGVRWAAREWDKAYQMYKDLGEKHGLMGAPRPEATPINYRHFLVTTNVERTAEAVAARKRFFKAEWVRLHTAEAGRVLSVYEDPAAFGPPSTWDKARATGWKRLFLKYPDFGQDQAIQEDTYELQHKYLSLVQEVRGPEQKRWVKAVSDSLLQAAAAPLAGPLWLPSVPLPRAVTLPLKGPFDDVNDRNEPLLSKEAVINARVRLQLPVEQPAAPTTVPQRPPRRK